MTLGSGINNASSDGATSAEAIASNGVISVGGESGAKVEATFSRDASHTVIKTITLTSTSSQAVVLTSSDLDTLGDGTITVSVTQTDAAGNAQTATAATTTFVLDTAAPAAPSVTLGSGINNATSNGATSAEAIASNGVISVSGESGSTVVATFSDGTNSVTKTITLSATDSAQPVVLGSSDIGNVASTTTLHDGTISVTASITDMAGNVQATSTATSFVLDTVALAPSVTLRQWLTISDGATSAEALASNGCDGHVGGESGDASSGYTISDGMTDVTNDDNLGSSTKQLTQPVVFNAEWRYW